MRSIRQLSTKRLIASVVGLAAVIAAVSGIAIAATVGGGPKPAPKRLDVALRDALTARPVKGLSARIRFTNHLVGSSGVQAGGPLLSGGSGRVWASNDGRLRLELQSDGGGGDAQVVIDGRHASVYDPGSNTLYRASLPTHGERKGTKENSAPPTIAQVDRVLGKIARRGVLSGAVPVNAAGKPGYSVTVSPKRGGGLLRSVRLAWDAASGVPLEASVYATTSASPVLSLKATDIAYGPVPGATFTIAAPKGARVVDMTKRLSDHAAKRGHRRDREVKGVAAVRKAVGFPLKAPVKLAGRRRSRVRLIRSGDKPAALVTYGNDLGGIAVIETAVAPEARGSAGKPRKGGQVPGLSKVALDGVTGRELPTAFGTVITYHRGGVDYTVIGSVAPAVAEAAAKAL